MLSSDASWFSGDPAELKRDRSKGITARIAAVLSMLDLVLTLRFG
jgi:hypothetical protein